MCLSSPSTPAPPAVDPAVEIERENQQAAETQKKAEAKKKALEETVRKRKAGTTGGKGGLSLITGSRGGLGYYDETL
jgi:hypothetical protein